MTDRPTDTARRQRPRYAERLAGKYETASAHRGTVTSLLTELTVLQNCIAEHLIINYSLQGGAATDWGVIVLIPVSSTYPF